MSASYLAGRRARLAGCWRVLCCYETDEQLQDWLAGWDDQDAELKGGAA